ncbi:hypothetical protein [Kangiella shandongensis]|uniref:hypothetical protein n=1 Tax=Kangiella shandongensis TaxID=2763258 RepID=UPI001CBCFE13|nr:hypothetical protein [Kangiella shandongensis]
MKCLFFIIAFLLYTPQSTSQASADATIEALEAYKGYAESCYVELVLEGLDSMKNYKSCEAVTHTRENYMNRPKFSRYLLAS